MADEETVTNPSLNSTLLMRLYYVRKNLMQMLYDRGYLVHDSELSITMDDFRARYAENLSRRDLGVTVGKPMTTVSASHDQVIVAFSEETIVTIATIRSILERMKNSKIYNCILVVQKPVKKKEALLECVSSRYNLEIFEESELLVNVMEHVLVPKHEVLSSEEKKAVLERYMSQENQLPRMREDDPVAKYYGFKRGQVIKIYRTDEDNEVSIFYRIVVPVPKKQKP